MESIQIFDDLIDEAKLDDVMNFIHARGYRYGWHSNKQVTFGHWNLPLSATGTKSDNRKDIRSELPACISQLWESFQPSHVPNAPVLVRAYSNGYTYGNEGYVHQDSQMPEDMTAIVFLNKEWNTNWAGETAIFDETSGEIIKAVLPKWRRLLIFPSNLYHVGRGVSRICPQLRNVLVFKARPAKVDEPSVTLLDKTSIIVPKTEIEVSLNSGHGKIVIAEAAQKPHTMDTHRIIPNFFSGAAEMREHFDRVFADPYGSFPPNIWEWWYVPGTYSYLRTLAKNVFPKHLLDDFANALKALGLGRPTWPMLGMYLSGMRQEVHNDAAAGKFAYVLSLTRNERRSIGGETLVWKPESMNLATKPNAGTGFYDIVPPNFGQLLLFDDRCPHSVVTVQGASEPLDARVVLVGHLQA